MSRKRLLFLGVGFYSYDQALIEALSNEYLVSYLNLNQIQDNNSLLYSIFSRIRAHSFLNRMGKNIVLNKLKELLVDDFDHVFIIKGTFLYDEALSLITKRVEPNCICLYLWDSVYNLNNISYLKKWIKRIYSFDIEDCKQYDFIYRPLFYIGTTVSSSIITRKDVKYDLSFVGINHSNRILWLSAFDDFAKKNNLNTFFFLSTEKRTILKYWIINLLTNKEYSFLHNNVLPYKQYENVTLHSNAVVDFPNAQQSGLTIRSIEAMCMGIKLITTNIHIKENKDIPQNLYYCIDNVNQINEELLSFLNSNQTSSMPQRYYIDGFLKELGLID